MTIPDCCDRPMIADPEASYLKSYVVFRCAVCAADRRIAKRRTHVTCPRCGNTKATVRKFGSPTAVRSGKRQCDCRKCYHSFEIDPPSPP